MIIASFFICTRDEFDYNRALVRAHWFDVDTEQMDRGWAENYVGMTVWPWLREQNRIPGSPGSDGYPRYFIEEWNVRVQPAQLVRTWATDLPVEPGMVPIEDTSRPDAPGMGNLRTFALGRWLTSDDQIVAEEIPFTRVPEWMASAVEGWVSATLWPGIRAHEFMDGRGPFAPLPMVTGSAYYIVERDDSGRTVKHWDI